MAGIKKPIRYSKDKDKDNLQRVLDRHHDILNGGISLGNVPSPTGGLGQTVLPGNIDNTHVTVQTPGVVNTDFTFNHNLGRVPTGFIIVNPAAKVTLWRGTVAWTDSQMTLQADNTDIIVVLQIY